MITPTTDFSSSTGPYVLKGGMHNFERRLPQGEAPKDISGWTIEKIDFPEGYSFDGWNLEGTIFIECDLPCDFTGAKTDGMELDCCTIKYAKGLDITTLAENRYPNPYDRLAEPNPAIADIPLRTDGPPRPFFAKLT